MALLKFFKGKKSQLQKRSEKRGKRKTGLLEVTSKKELKKETRKEPPTKKAPSLQAKAPVLQPEKRGGIKVAPTILASPQITEKATSLQNQNCYVFKVFSTATKPEIKKSVEEVYGVDVLSVRVVNVPRKGRRLGRSRGFQSGYKKAIVKINPAQTIEILPR